MGQPMYITRLLELLKAANNAIHFNTLNTLETIFLGATRQIRVGFASDCIQSFNLKS